MKGGKLPGLYGGTKSAAGRNRRDRRLLHLAHVAGRRRGRGVPLRARRVRDEPRSGDWTWDRGTWLCVEQHVVLNDPEEEDGSVTVWVDGTRTFSEEGMRYRTVADLRIDGIFFSTFYGGADPSWAPSTDQHADFAGFAVSDQPIGCG